MTLVEGEQGVVVIDPLISAETAAAALGLYRSHRGDRPVTAVIYTHSHVDHFGGVQGVVADQEVPILAPSSIGLVVCVEPPSPSCWSTSAPRTRRRVGGPKSGQRLRLAAFASF